MTGGHSPSRHGVVRAMARAHYQVSTPNPRPRHLAGAESGHTERTERKASMRWTVLRWTPWHTLRLVLIPLLGTLSILTLVSCSVSSVGVYKTTMGASPTPSSGPSISRDPTLY